MLKKRIAWGFYLNTGLLTASSLQCRNRCSPPRYLCRSGWGYTGENLKRIHPHLQHRNTARKYYKRHPQKIVHIVQGLAFTMCTPAPCKEPKYGGVERMTITWRKIHNKKCLRAVRTEGLINLSVLQMIQGFLELLKKGIALPWDFYYIHIFFVAEMGFPCYRILLSPRESLMKYRYISPLWSKRCMRAQRTCKHNSDIY